MRTFFLKNIIFAMEQMKSLFESIEKPKYTDDPWENFKMSPLWEIANGLPPKKAQPKTTTAVPETKTTEKPWFKKDLKEMTVADCVMSLKQLNMRILELPFDERRWRCCGCGCNRRYATLKNGI